TTSLRSSNWTHQTSPRCTSPPDTGWQADAARARRAVETGAATVDHRCVKTEEHAVAAGHSVNPARWQEAFEGLMSRIAGRFTRVESRRRARKLVLGLLSDLPRKNCWTIAEWAGDRTPDGYVLAVACSHEVTTGARKFRADTLARKVPKRAWQKLSSGVGAK